MCMVSMVCINNSGYNTNNSDYIWLYDGKYWEILGLCMGIIWDYWESYGIMYGITGIIWDYVWDYVWDNRYWLVVDLPRKIMEFL